MKAADLEPHVHAYSLADDPFENGHAAVTYILERKYPATAMLCGSEEPTLGAREALHQHGRDVPRDVSLIGLEQKLTLSRFKCDVRLDRYSRGRPRVRSHGHHAQRIIRKRSARSHRSFGASEAQHLPSRSGKTT